MAGLLNRETKSSLPLRASSIWTDIRGFSARTTATLTYYNDHRLEVIGLFVLPLDFASQIVEFEANVEGRYIFVDIKSEKDTGKTGIYDDDVRNNDLFSICIGKLSPWILIDLQITIVTEINWLNDKLGLKFTLPSIFTPRIVQDTRMLHNTKESNSYTDFPAISTLGYSLQIEVNVEAPCLLAGVTSDTFPIQINAMPQNDDASRIRVSLPDDFKHSDQDFELSIYLSRPRDPFIYIEQARQTHTNEVAEQNPISNIMNNPILMLSYCPDISAVLKEDNGFCPSEFIFMIDRSGSMNGNLINSAKQAILLFLHSLPVNSYFNVISFGTYFQSLFKESQPYSQTNLEDACNHVRKIRADMGGTSLLEPLEWVFGRPLRKAVPRQIFMVTDGMVMDASNVIECVRKPGHYTRIFTFGLGTNICRKFLQELADATHGKSEVVLEGDRLQSKVIEKFKAALQPGITNLRTSWILPDGYDVVYTPERIPTLFDGDRLSLYAILAKRHDLDTTSNGKRSQRTSTGSVKEFWFEEDEFDVELICDEQSDKDKISKSMSSDSDIISHESLVCNAMDPDELRLCPETEDCNDSEVFLTEEEAERISEAYTWQYRKRSSIDRVQSWKVSRNPDSVDSDNALGVPIYENQWRSAERLLPKSKSYHEGKESRFSASTGDIRKHYCSSKEGNDSFEMAHSHDQCIDSVHRFLGHPGYPTRHNSARSNEGRSPIQKSCTEMEMFSNHDTGQYVSSSEMGFKPGYHDHIRPEVSRDESFGNDEGKSEKRHDPRYPRSMPSSEDEYGDLREYNIDALRKEARRLKQSLSDDHVNSHFIDESNINILCSMITILVIEKRRRLLDFISHQEEFVKCNWDKQYERYKQCTNESGNRRDSGIGNRSSSEPKSDHEEEALHNTQHSKLEPQRGLFSVSSSGYFEQEKFIDDKRVTTSRTFSYLRRQTSDECRSDKSGKSNLSGGRPQSAADYDSHETANNRIGNTESHTAHHYGHARSVASDGASGKSHVSLHSNDNLAGIARIDALHRKSSENSERHSASSENAVRRRENDTPLKDGDSRAKWKSKDSLTEAKQGSQSSPEKSPGFSGNKSVFSSFIDGVKSLASRLSEKSTDNSNDKQQASKASFQGIFSRQSTSDNGGRVVKRSSKIDSESNENGKQNNNIDTDKNEDKVVKKSTKNPLSKEVSLDKSLAKSQVKRQSSMRYTKPILERSRTISTSVMHDLGDGEEISGDNITLNPNQGMIYLSGCIGRRIFKRLIPFKLTIDPDDESERSREPTIHQLCAKSILRDLEQQMEDDVTLDSNGKDYISKLIGEVSRSARIPSKYTTLVAIDDRCEEGQALCIRRYGRNRSRTLSQRSKQDIPNTSTSKSPPLYEIQRQEVKQIEIGNKTQKVMTTKLTLFTSKPRPEKPSLLSPVSASRHTLMVQRRLFDSSGYMRMVDIQSSDGSWNLNDELAEAIPAPMAKLKQCCPFVDISFEVRNENKPNPGPEVGEINDKIWATSLALRWLTRLWSQYEGEWILVAQKAQRWLEMQRKPTGFELDDVKLMAQQSLNVLIVSSRRSSCH